MRLATANWSTGTAPGRRALHVLSAGQGSRVRAEIRLQREAVNSALSTVQPLRRKAEWKVGAAARNSCQRVAARRGNVACYVPILPVHMKSCFGLQQPAASEEGGAPSTSFRCSRTRQSHGRRSHRIPTADIKRVDSALAHRRMSHHACHLPTSWATSLSTKSPR